jgi:hypothetical protein
MANSNIPTLPRDTWDYIFKIRATKMWFEQKCLPEIQQVVYYNMETCNQQHGAACSQVYYKDKTVSYRTIWTNFGVPIGVPESMCLHVCRTWLETEYQVRFKKRCDVWLIDAWCRMEHYWQEEHMDYIGKPIVPRAVRVEVEPAFVNAKVRTPKQLQPVMSFPAAQAPQPPKALHPAPSATQEPGAMDDALLQRYFPSQLLPGQKCHFTSGVVVANAYWNFVPLQPQAQPQSAPKAQPNAQAEGVGAQQAINRKRKAALERIENKRVATMLEAPVHGRKTEGEVLFAIEEMIGPSKTWPARINDIFFLRKLNRTDRLNIITFTLGNGLPPHVLHQWIAVRQVECDKAKFNVDLEAVLQSMTLNLDNKPAEKYFYFDLVLQEWCFMNGIPRNNNTNTPKRQKEAQSPP